MRKALLLLLVLTLAVVGTGTDFLQKRISILEASLSKSVAGSTVKTGTEKLVNTDDGYSLDYPGEMTADLSREPVVTLLESDTARLEIYHEKLKGIGVVEYIEYSNTPIIDGRDPVKILKNSHGFLNGHKVFQLWWERKKLLHVVRDKNYYAVINIVISNNELYSFHFKASDPKWLEQHAWSMVKSFKQETPVREPTWRMVHTNERKYPLNQDTGNFFNGPFMAGQKWGIFEPGAPGDMQTLTVVEKKLDFKFNYLLAYSNMDSPMPLARLEQAGQDNRYVEYTLQTLLAKRSAKYSIMYDLLDGKYDQFLHQFARSIAQYRKPVLFRLNNEMNGDWCGYSSYFYSQDSQLYQAFWQYLFEIFHQEGADNALWVWNPNDRSFPNFKWNNALMYYPGDQYVDIIGLTGYNTGTYYSAEKWRGFAEIYQPLYREYETLYADKPFMITEFAASSIGGDKAAWITDAFSQLKNYPKIKLAVWWNSIDYDGEKKARIYRLEDEASIDAFREGLKSTVTSK